MRKEREVRNAVRSWTIYDESPKALNSEDPLTDPLFVRKERDDKESVDEQMPYRKTMYNFSVLFEVVEYIVQKACVQNMYGHLRMPKSH